MTSLLARLKTQETFLVRFWSAFLPLLAIVLVIRWLA